VSAPEAKPAAALSATLIRRGDGRAVPAAAAPPPTAPERRGAGKLTISHSPGKGAAVGKAGEAHARRRVSLRGAGLFGMLYLAALALFAAAFDMWAH
jgi:hypothetical protein